VLNYNFDLKHIFKFIEKHLMETETNSAQERYSGKPDPCGNAQ
tara:strand:- start:287 stop:415 length:129 start_codon:yes stop_codon:yes gene_type:complete